MSFKKSLISALLATSCLASMSASATSLNFEFNSGWDINSATLSSGTGSLQSSGLDGVVGAYHNINWGVGSVRSGLRIVNHNGVLSDDGSATLLANLFHDNRSISNAAATLTSSDWISLLNFTDIAGAAGRLEPSIKLNFTETPNETPCHEPNPNHSICDDYFELSGAPFTYQIDYAGTTYNIDLFLSAISNGVEIDGINYTREGQTSNLGLYARMNAFTPKVPEPATLALFGLGLAGFAGLRRRKAA